MFLNFAIGIWFVAKISPNLAYVSYKVFLINHNECNRLSQMRLESPDLCHAESGVHDEADGTDSEAGAEGDVLPRDGQEEVDHHQVVQRHHRHGDVTGREKNTCRSPEYYISFSFHIPLRRDLAQNGGRC